MVISPSRAPPRRMPAAILVWRRRPPCTASHSGKDNDRAAAKDAYGLDSDCDAQRSRRHHAGSDQHRCARTSLSGSARRADR